MIAPAYYFTMESLLIASSVLLFSTENAKICKKKSILGKTILEIKYLENGLVNFIDTYIIFRIF